MARAARLFLHIALALGWAAGEAPNASSFHCYLPENVSNIDVRGCNTSPGPVTAAQCFLRCVDGFALPEAGPTLARRGWAVCREEGGVFQLPDCVAQPDMVVVQGGTVQWNVPRDPVTKLPCERESMAVRPDGQIVLTAGTPVRVWDVSALPLVRELVHLNNSSADSVRFSADGKWAFTYKYHKVGGGDPDEAWKAAYQGPRAYAPRGDGWPGMPDGSDGRRWHDVQEAVSLTICKWSLDDHSHPVWESSVPYDGSCKHPPVLTPDAEHMYLACVPMKLIDVASGNLTVLEVADIPDMRTDSNMLQSLVTGAAGAWVAAADRTDTIYVLSPAQELHPGAKQLYQWAPGVVVDGLTATHDGRHLLVGSGNAVFMHSVWTGARVASFQTTGTATDGRVDAMTLSPDDGWLWAAGGGWANGTDWAALWNVHLLTAAPAFEVKGLSSGLSRKRSRVALTPDGRWGLVVASAGVWVYDLRLRPAKPPTALDFPHFFRGSAVRYGTGSSQMEDAYAFLGIRNEPLDDGDGGSRTLNEAFGFNLRSRTGTDVGLMVDLQCTAKGGDVGSDMGDSPSGWRLCTSYVPLARTVRLINVLTGRLRNITVGFNVSSTAVTPDGERLFVLGGPSGARTLAMYALLKDTPSPCKTWALPPTDDDTVLDMQVGQSGSLVVVSYPSGITAWDLHSDHARLLCNYSGVRLVDKLVGNTSRTLPVAIAPDESEVLVPAALHDYTVLAWSLRACLPQPVANYTAQWVFAPNDMFTISPDGDWLMLTNAVDKKAYLWDRHGASNLPVVEWSVSAKPLVASTSPDGAWAILLHQHGVDLWPVLPTFACDRVLAEAWEPGKKVDSLDFKGRPVLQTLQTAIRVPSWLDATSLRMLDIRNASVTDFDWQVPSTLLRMNLSGTRAQGGGLKLHAAWLQTMGMVIDLRGVPDVDVGELAANPRFQRELSSCAPDFIAHGFCLRRQRSKGVRRLADGRVCSSAFAVWEAGGDGGALVKRADIYADTASLNQWLCDCPEGTYGDGDVCTPCPQDSFCPAPRADAAQAANEAAHPCPTNSGTNGAGRRTSNSSCFCRPGWWSVGGGGVAPCEPCQDSSFAGGWGADTCRPCGFGRRPNDDLVACDLHWAYLTALGSLAALSAGVALACPLACGRGLPLADVSLEDGRVVLTTTRNHRFLRHAPKGFDVQMHGTGCPGLDRQGAGLLAFPKPFKVRVLSSKRLLLLDQQGDFITVPLDASQGTVRVQLPQAFLALGVFGVPVGVLLLLLLAAWVSSVAALVDLEPTSPNVTVVSVVLTLAVAFGFVKDWRWQRAAACTPMRTQIQIFRDRIRKQHPCPRACERGPGRAVTMAQLDDLYRAFRPFIRDTRTMYYLWENVLKPITAPEKLSYAELVGPSVVQWFCSHFWGTPFAHFVESVRKHALAVGERAGREGQDAGLMSYWICSLSNNQWTIGDELPGPLQNSSFYLALCSGHCRGTTMILDEEATPLTRSWCLFEVIQTLRLSREDAHFQGLLLCTSTGVMNYGEARLDVAKAIAKRLLTLDLRQASATSEEDKVTIDNLVVQEFGGFQEVNDFVRGRIRDALDTMRVRVDEDLSQLALAMAGAPLLGALSSQRQPTLPLLLGPSNREGPFDARRASWPAAKHSPTQGAETHRDEFPDM